jgi:hypothetical protein
LRVIDAFEPEADASQSLTEQFKAAGIVWGDRGAGDQCAGKIKDGGFGGGIHRLGKRDGGVIQNGVVQPT